LRDVAISFSTEWQDSQDVLTGAVIFSATIEVGRDGASPSLSFARLLAEDPALEDRWSDKSSFQSRLAVQAIEAGHLADGEEDCNGLPARV